MEHEFSSVFDVYGRLWVISYLPQHFMCLTTTQRHFGPTSPEEAFASSKYYFTWMFDINFQRESEASGNVRA